MADYNFNELIDDPDIQAEIKAKKKKDGWETSKKRISNYWKKLLINYIRR